MIPAELAARLEDAIACSLSTQAAQRVLIHADGASPEQVLGAALDIARNLTEQILELLEGSKAERDRFEKDIEELQARLEVLADDIRNLHADIHKLRARGAS